MHRRRLLMGALAIAGCARAPDVAVEGGPPAPISTDFGRLKAALEGIRGPGEVALYEGLPSVFWEPLLREQELGRKPTTRLHGYRFYDERIAPRGEDAGRFTALFSARDSFQRHREGKACGGYHPDYCIEWAVGGEATRALISLECGEVNLFGPRSELHCDLRPEPWRRLARWLDAYRKNRPAAESGR